MDGEDPNLESKFASRGFRIERWENPVAILWI
jgi:hypothetical protein